MIYNLLSRLTLTYETFKKNAKDNTVIRHKILFLHDDPLAKNFMAWKKLDQWRTKEKMEVLKHNADTICS